jgi:hypothetical protein
MHAALMIPIVSEVIVFEKINQCHLMSTRHSLPARRKH